MDPSIEYNSRLDARRRWRDWCWQRIRTISHIRLVAGLSFFAALWAAFLEHRFSGWFVLLPLAVYIGLVVYHERLHRTGRRSMRAVAFYERGVARVEDRWIGEGNTDTSFVDDSHL